MKAHLLKGIFVFILTIGSTSQVMAITAVTSGDWTSAATWGGTAPTGNMSNQDVIIPSGITVNMNIDVTFSGLLNNFTVDGTLNSSTNRQLYITSGTFTGSGDVDIQRIVFDGALTTYSHTGDLMVNTFHNMGSVLTLTSHITVTDSLNLDGGSLTLNTGGNLMVNTNAFIVRDGGTLGVSGGVFASGGAYHVRYIGGNKTTGIEINSLNLQDADISLDDNNSTLTLGSDMMVHGNLKLNTGILVVGANDLELHGNLNVQTGSMLSTTSSSNLMIETSTTMNSGLVFTDGSAINQFMIDYSGSGNLKLESDLDIAGELQLENGTFSIESGSTLTMNGGSLVQVMGGELESNGGTFDGSASYDVDYMSDATLTTGLEGTGTGLNDVQINMENGDVTMDNDMTVNGEFEMVDGNFDLNGNDLILNGTINSADESKFIGDENSDLHLNITVVGEDTIYFDPSNQNLDQFVLNVNGGDIVLASKLQINDEMTMTSGNLILYNDNLVIEQDANITGYNENRYIITTAQGRLEMYVEASMPYVIFPVGTQSSYSPASIQQAAGGTSTNFKVKAFNGLYVGGTEGSGFNSANGGSVVNRTWLVESGAANVNMTLKLGWMTTSEVNGFDRTNAYISHYVSNDWDDETAVNATAGANGTWEVTRTGITSLSPFAVADQNAELFVDENAVLNINVYPNPSTDVINIDYTSADEYAYVVTDLAGRTYDVVDNGNNQMDVSELSSGVYLLRMTNVKTNKTAVRQFVKN